MPNANDMSRCLTALEQDSTIIAVVDDATSYCIPFYVVKIPWLFGRDLVLPDGLARFSPLRDLAS